jgi:hypothetical protein
MMNATGTGGAIMSVSNTGGTPKTLVPNLNFPWAIAADANNVYWTNYGNNTANMSGGDTTVGTVMQASLSGSNVITLATGLEDPYGIAVDATNVYFTTYAGGRVKKVPIGNTAGNSAVTVLAQGLSNPAYIAVSGGNVYWTNYGDGTVDSISTSLTAPGTPNVLATDAAGQNANGIAVSGGDVFYAASNDPGAVYRVTTAGAANTSLAGMQNTPWGVAVGNGNLYWTTFSNPGSLMSVPTTGGMAVTLGNNFNDPTAVAVDSTGVYTAGAGGHVWRITGG